MENVASWSGLAWASLTVLSSGLGVMSWIDFRTGYLPDPLQILLAVAGVAVVAAGSPVGITWPLALAGAAFNAGVFYGLRWLVSRVKGREAMGLGDVKLVAVGGIWLGPWALPYIMAVGGILTLVGMGVASVVLRRAVWREEMPLGPGLAIGIFGCYAAALLHMPWLKLTGP